MFEFLKNLAEQHEWQFEYGRQDYQNLAELEPNKVGLFVDPIEIISQFTDYGDESQSFSVRVMFLVNSDVDEEYLTKYNNYIKPLLDNEVQLLIEAFACSDFTITSWRTLEVINVHDVNGDGVLISLTAALND